MWALHVWCCVTDLSSLTALLEYLATCKIRAQSPSPDDRCQIIYNFVRTYYEPLNYANLIFDRCVATRLCQQTRFIVPVESAGANRVPIVPEDSGSHRHRDYVQRHCDLPVDNGFDPACLDRMEVWTQLFTLLLQGGYVSAPTALMYYDAMKKFFKWAWFSNNDHKAQCAHLLTKVKGFHKRCSSDAHGNRAARNAILLKTGEIDKTGDQLRAICKAFRETSGMPSEN